VTGPGGFLSRIERGISPAWSPDGEQLMFSSATQKRTRMYLLDLATRQYDEIANFATLSLDWKPNESSF
jgi:Tol biopolymer transport system component